jgi:hypothetical protein
MAERTFNLTEAELQEAQGAWAVLSEKRGVHRDLSQVREAQDLACFIQASKNGMAGLLSIRSLKSVLPALEQMFESRFDI